MVPDAAAPDEARIAGHAPSRTAIGVAWMRAAHQYLDDACILLDPVIAQLLPDAANEIVRHVERFQAPGARGLRSHVVLRSRITEDALHDAVARGVRQYLILGAGLDTFAYRPPAWARDIAIFEIDQPASQAEKRALLSAARITIPPNVTLVPVDFERDSLDGSLRAAGVDLSQRVFVSWLGVTMYLTRAAIEDVLRFVASLADGSEIVLTFAPPRERAPDGAPTLADRAAEVGEPWISYFTPDEIEALLRSAGFSHVEIPTVEAIRARYFPDGDAALPPPRRATVARAVV